MTNIITYIVNGISGVGKDTFVNQVSSTLTGIDKNIKCVTMSSVDPIDRFIVELTGEDINLHSIEVRNLIAQIKRILITSKLTEDALNAALIQRMRSIYSSDKTKKYVFFLMIREPSQIENFISQYPYNVKTILFNRNNVEELDTGVDNYHIVSNYPYDSIIDLYDGVEKNNPIVLDMVTSILNYFEVSVFNLKDLSPMFSNIESFILYSQFPKIIQFDMSILNRCANFDKYPVSSGMMRKFIEILEKKFYNNPEIKLLYVNSTEPENVVTTIFSGSQSSHHQIIYCINFYFYTRESENIGNLKISLAEPIIKKDTSLFKISFSNDMIPIIHTNDSDIIEKLPCIVRLDNEYPSIMEKICAIVTHAIICFIKANENKH